MIEDDVNSNRCRFCYSSFSDEILKKIEDDRNDVYCENCGDLIKRVQNKYNINPTEIIEKESKANTNDTPVKPQKELEDNSDALHYPIGRIFYDKEFPLIFKSNFIVVFSRLTYFHALHLEREGQIELGGLEVPENAINNLFMSIRHVQDKRIKSEFLNNLHEISKEKFERHLKQLQAKIQSSRQYREDFIVYSRWLISKVYLLISNESNKDNLSKFDLTIYKDLKNQKKLFESKLEQLAIKPTNTTFVKRRSESKRIIEARINFEQNVLNELKSITVNYEDHELLYKTVKKIVKNAISQPNQLSIDDLPSGCKINPKYTASAFIYYGLRHTDYNDKYEKYKLYGVMEYIKEFYSGNKTMLRALQSIIPLIYRFLSVEKSSILYFPKSKKYNIEETVKERRQNLWIENRSKIFKNDLEKLIDEFSKVFAKQTLIKKITKDLLADAISEPNSFSKQEILESHIRLTTPKYYCVALLFLAYNHEDYNKEKLGISNFSRKYFPSYVKENNSTISFLYKFISPEVKGKINYIPIIKYKDKYKKFDELRLWELVKEYLQAFVDTERKKYLNQAKSLFSSSKEGGFDLQNLESKNPKFLAATLVYYSLILSNNFNFILKESFLNHMRNAEFTIGNKVYRLISDFNPYVLKYLENEIETDVNATELNTEKSKIVISIKNRSTIKREFFLHKLLEIREKHKQNDRNDNVILCDLILKSLEFYEDFNAFTKDAQFLRSSGSPKQILLRLSKDNLLGKKQDLDRFIVKYLNFIDRLNTSLEIKKSHTSLLTHYYQERKNRFDEHNKQKKVREKQRRAKYGDLFFSHAVRVERFLIMLGFSPFDGYDIWENRVIIDDKIRLYANFHHIKYVPEEKSKRELVFIPQKPPKKYQKNTDKFLSHSMIAGMEGNLKRNDISNIVRHKIERELKSIQNIIDFNSKILEKAVITFNPELILKLKGWSKECMKRAIDRINDREFSWAKDVEKGVPTAGGYENERVEHSEVKRIIQEILNEGERRILD